MPNFIWPAIAPLQSSELRLIFAPTRTVIGSNVRMLTGTSEDPGALESRDLNAGATVSGLTVEVLFGETPPPDRQVHLRIPFEGERPQVFAADWQAPGALRTFPTPADAYARLYEKRKDLAAKDERQAFMFDLDRHTAKELLPHNEEVDGDEANARTAALECIHPMLLERLQYRLDNARDPEPFDRAELIAPFSCIFWEAAEKLIRRSDKEGARLGVRLVGDVLEAFAAGLLRRTISFESKDVSDVIVSEPDSFFVFFFAEFASAAVETRDRFGAEWAAIMDSAVRMQRLFIERFPLSEPLRGSNHRGPYRRLIDYSDPPPRPLEAREVDALRHHLAMQKANHSTRYNLSLLAKEIGVFSSPPIRCYDEAPPAAERDPKSGPVCDT